MCHPPPPHPSAAGLRYMLIYERVVPKPTRHHAHGAGAAPAAPESAGPGCRRPSRSPFPNPSRPCKPIPTRLVPFCRHCGLHGRAWLLYSEPCRGWCSSAPHAGICAGLPPSAAACRGLSQVFVGVRAGGSGGARARGGGYAEGSAQGPGALSQGRWWMCGRGTRRCAASGRSSTRATTRRRRALTRTRACTLTCSKSPVAPLGSNSNKGAGREKGVEAWCDHTKRTKNTFTFFGKRLQKHMYVYDVVHVYFTHTFVTTTLHKSDLIGQQPYFNVY